MIQLVHKSRASLSQRKSAALQIVFSKGTSKAAFFCAQEGLLSQGFPSSHSKWDSTGVSAWQGEVVPLAQLPNDQLLSASH